MCDSNTRFWGSPSPSANHSSELHLDSMHILSTGGGTAPVINRAMSATSAPPPARRRAHDDIVVPGFPARGSSNGLGGGGEVVEEPREPGGGNVVRELRVAALEDVEAGQHRRRCKARGGDGFFAFLTGFSAAHKSRWAMASSRS